MMIGHLQRRRFDGIRLLLMFEFFFCFFHSHSWRSRCRSMSQTTVGLVASSAYAAERLGSLKMESKTVISWHTEHTHGWLSKSEAIKNKNKQK
jgi:hypothetical protein